MKRLNCHRAVTVSVDPITHPPSTYPDAPTISTPTFMPFSFDVPETLDLITLVMLYWGRLPKPDRTGQKERYLTFIDRNDVTGKDCSWAKDGPVSACMRQDQDGLNMEVG